jgi:MazG family protein
MVPSHSTKFAKETEDASSWFSTPRWYHVRNVAHGMSTPGEAFQTLVDIMARLRGREGCPWDREQTLESLRAFLLEETHEVLDAIDRGDYAGLKGEIGDLIFEGVFLAQICSDEGRFTVADSLDAINAKLIRRHPHIFDPFGRPLEHPSEVMTQWEQIKAQEQAESGEQRGVLKGLARSLPALLRAHEIGTRVAAVGFDWARTDDVVDKIEEEVAELRDANSTEGAARTEEEMGDLLFSIANLARKMGIDPESALRKANEKFTKRFEALEAWYHARGRSVHDATLEDMESVWQKIKTRG